jgi:hypothetical protein
MAKGKPPAWAVELAARVAAGTSMSAAPTKATKTTRTKKASAKRTGAKKLRPGLLARVLASASALPKNEAVWIACQARLSELIDSVDNDTSALGELLGIDRRSAQRLRARYGIERRLVNGVWR